MINDDVAKQIGDHIEGLLQAYSKELTEVLKGEGQIAISLPVRMQVKGKELNIEAGISFTTAKIKDAVTFTVNNQLELFSDT